MIAAIEKRNDIGAPARPVGARPLAAAYGFALGLALAVAAATLWVLSLFGHDDGKDVAGLLIAALACFGLGAHLMDRAERRND